MKTTTNEMVCSYVNLIGCGYSHKEAIKMIAKDWGHSRKAVEALVAAA